MSSTIAYKPVSVSVPAPAAHPFEAGVRKEIADLRAQLTQLRTGGQLDPFTKSQVKNLEAQLGKKNANLASLTAGVSKAAAAPSVAKSPSPEFKMPAAAKPLSAPSTQPAAPQQSFGALGARLKGRLAPNLAAQLASSVPSDIEKF